MGGLAADKFHRAFSNKLEYWNERYLANREPFDWFHERHSDFDRLINDITLGSCSCQILHVGCGSSVLPEKMYDDGYHGIVNIDVSGVVVTQMLARNIHRSKMLWLLMDATQMAFRDDWFDVALEKGMLDTFACMRRTDLIEAYFKEILRVL